MPNYIADIEWIKQTHPDQFTRIPPEFLSDPDMHQMHGASMIERDGIMEEDGWLILFFKDSDDPDYTGEAIVELSVPRPDADPDSGQCPYHTLLVSRPLCPDCGHHTVA